MGILTGIMAGASALSGLIGTITNIASTKKKEQQEEQAAARQQAHYDAEAAQNGLQTATAQAAMNKMDRDAQKTMEQVEAKSRIMGGTPEIALAAQEQLAQAKADTMSNIAVNYENNVAQPAKDKAEAARQQHEANLQAMQDQKIASAQNAITAGLDAAGAIAGSVAPESTTTGGARKSAAPKGSAPQVSATKNATGQATYQFTNADGSPAYGMNRSGKNSYLDVINLRIGNRNL